MLGCKPHDLSSTEAQDAGLAHTHNRLAQLTEASFALLELIFPRHIIEFMSDSHQTAEGLLPHGGDLRPLSTNHEQVGRAGGTRLQPG